MLCPVCCVTCGAILANKCEKYQELRLEKKKELEQNTKATTESVSISSKKINKHFDQENYNNYALEKLNITRMCCRRVMLSYVDLISNI